MDDYHSLEKVYRQPIQLSWAVVDGIRTPTLRDAAAKLVYPFNEYLDSLVIELSKRDLPESAIRSSVDAATYALLGLANHLARKQQSLSAFSDSGFKEFRKSSFQEVKSNTRSRGSEHQAKRTVNTKLRAIYHFLADCQKARRLPIGFIGWGDCRVKSSLLDCDRRPDVQNKTQKHKFPLCYARVGTKSRTDTSQYWATDTDVERIEELLWSKGSGYVVRRSIVMLRVAEKSGWRVSSLNSLLVEDFSLSELARQEHLDEFQVTPSRQKGGLNVSFQIPWELAAEVRRHIDEDRSELLKKLELPEQRTSALFLSQTTGKPLTDKHVTTLFASAFRAIDAPKGAGEHALRRKRGADVADDEIMYRKSVGILVVPEDVAAVVQTELGHSTRAAQMAYRRASGKHRRESTQAVLRNRLMAAQLRGDRLQAKVDELERQLAEYA